MPWICFAMPVQPLGRQLDDGHRLRHFSQRPITRIIISFPNGRRRQPARAPQLS